MKEWKKKLPFLEKSAFFRSKSFQDQRVKILINIIHRKTYEGMAKVKIHKLDEEPFKYNHLINKNKPFADVNQLEI